MASNDFIVALNKHIEEDESITEAKLVMAREAAAYARSIAPIDQGDYRDGIRVANRGASGVGVEFSDHKSHWIEWGTVDMPEHAVIARTAEHFRNG